MAYTNTYQRINWQNLPSEATALNDVNLNKMDAEIYNHGEEFEVVDTAITNINSSLNGKVDKEAGKGLSAVKSITISPSVNTGTKIAEISYKNQDNLTIGYEIKNGVVVDSALSSSSENPVQNKVVKSAIDAKSTVSVTPVVTEGTTLANITIDGTTTAIKGSDIEVDSTPSATSENPLQNKAIYEMLNNLLPEETVQGNPIAISDASGLNAKACSVDLLPIQDLHGYDSPWPAGGGKNKSSVNSISGVAWAVANADLKNAFNSLQNGTYTISFDIKVKTVTSTGEWIYGFMAQNPNGNISKMNTVTTDATVGYEGSIVQTFTITDSNRGAFTSVNLYGCGAWVGGAKGTSDFSNIQIELGNQATDFAPYSNICPISGRTEVSVTRTGKNTANMIIDGYVPSIITGELINKDGTRSDFIRIKPSTNYVLSVDESQALYVLFYDINKGYISYQSGSGLSKSVITPSDARYVMLRTEKNTLNKAQFEIGSTATAYEPYQGETHTHQYSETIYGGVDDFVNGGAEKILVCESVSDLTWQSSTNGKFYSGARTSVIVKGTAGHYGDMIISSSYIGVNKPTTGALTNGEMSVDANGYIQICDTDCTDATDFFTKRGSVQLCYKLATPTELTTSAEQISLLKGDNVVSTDGDNIKLVYSSDIKAWVESQLSNS